MKPNGMASLCGSRSCLKVNLLWISCYLKLVIFFNETKMFVYKNTYPHGAFEPGGFGDCVNQSIFIHDPIRLRSLRRSTWIKHQSFLHSYALWSTRRKNWLVSSCCLPVSWGCSPVWPQSIWVLSVSRAKEIPLLFSKQRLICKFTTKTKTGFIFLNCIHQHGLGSLSINSFQKHL